MQIITQQETVNRLVAAFIESTDVVGKMPETVEIWVAKYQYRTPNFYPPTRPERLLLKERSAKFRVILPELNLNPSYAEDAEKSPATARDYWGLVARTIAPDITFEEILPWQSV